MRLRKLNGRGFSHEILLIAIVVVFGIAGSAYLVASHADSCTPPVSGATSGSTSGVGAACTPTSGASSAPFTGSQGFCDIKLSTTATPAYGASVQATIRVTNNGGLVFKPSFTTSLTTYDAKNKASLHGKHILTLANLSTDSSVSIAYPATYKIPYSSTSAVRATYLVTSTKPSYSCQTSLTLPAKS